MPGLLDLDRERLKDRERDLEKLRLRLLLLPPVGPRLADLILGGGLRERDRDREGVRENDLDLGYLQRHRNTEKQEL